MYETRCAPRVSPLNMRKPYPSLVLPPCQIQHPLGSSLSTFDQNRCSAFSVVQIIVGHVEPAIGWVSCPEIENLMPPRSV